MAFFNGQAYASEANRPSLSVNSGEVEAARSLGMTRAPPSRDCSKCGPLAAQQINSHIGLLRTSLTFSARCCGGLCLNSDLGG